MQKYKSSWSNIGALFLIGCFVGLFESTTPSTLAQVPPSLSASQALQNTRWEATFTSTKAYANAFLDVTLRVQYTGPNGQRIDGYGFWDGGSAFKIRMAFPEPGPWRYRTTASDATNSGLHQQEGVVDVLPYTGDNPLYQHGFLRVSADRRYLEHANGTPFVWLGDTLWGATVWLSEQGFHQAIDARRAQQFTVLQTNFARKAEVDTNGDNPWQGDRWNVDFMRKMDRMFNYTNDAGMYLFVNGLIDLKWDRAIGPWQRLVQMIAARYFAHYISFASSMDDPYAAEHDAINEALDQVTTRHLLTQHPGSARDGRGNVGTALDYYDKAYMDYVMGGTGVEGDLEASCRNIIEWSLRLYNHVPHKPTLNGEAWYEGVRGGIAEIMAHLAYVSMLSGNFGYSHGTALWNAKDADLPIWKAYEGAMYMKNLYNFFTTLDDGRPLVPRHELVMNQPMPYQDKMVVGVSTDGSTYAAFLPHGGKIMLDLSELPSIASVKWYNTRTAAYAGLGTTLGSAIRTFTSPFGTEQAVLVINAATPTTETMPSYGAKRQ